MSSIYRSSAPHRITAKKLTSRSPTARLVYIHLIHGEIAGQIPGLIRAGVLAVAEDAELEPEVVRAALAELETHGLAEVDLDARVIRLPDVLEDAERLHSNPSAVVGWSKVLADWPDSPLVARHAAAIRAVVPTGQRGLFDRFAQGAPVAWPPGQPPVTPPLSGGCPTVDAPRTQDTDPDPDPDPEQEHTPRAAEPSADDVATPAPEAPRSAPSATALELTPAPAARARTTRRKARAPLISSLECAIGQQVLAAWHDHRVELGLASGRAPTLTGARVAEIAKAGMDLETWLTVLRRAAEALRREAEDHQRPARECKGAQYFTLESLARPANRQRYLDLELLDHRRPSAPARASPRGRGPEPPQNPGALRPEIPTVNAGETA